MTAFWVVFGIASYLVFGGIVGAISLAKARSNCPLWKKTQEARRTGKYLPSYEQCEFDDHVSPFFIGALWPLAFPAILGVGIGSWLASREDRAESREKQKQADHERKMAELEAERAMTMESVKFLVENGIQADVPGLFDANRSAS